MYCKSDYKYFSDGYWKVNNIFDSIKISVVIIQSPSKYNV